MSQYISNPDNLKLMMKMLIDRSRNIQFEAFHVFKVNFTVCVVNYVQEDVSLLERCPSKCANWSLFGLFGRYLWQIPTRQSLFLTSCYETERNSSIS